MSTDKRQERATLDASQRQLTPEIRSALARLKAGSRCEMCSSPACVVRAGQLHCALCARRATIRRRAADMRAPRG